MNNALTKEKILERFHNGLIIAGNKEDAIVFAVNVCIQEEKDKVASAVKMRMKRIEEYCIENDILYLPLGFLQRLDDECFPVFKDDKGDE